MPYYVRDKEGKIIPVNTPEEEHNITIMGLSLMALVVILAIIGGLLLLGWMILSGFLNLFEPRMRYLLVSWALPLAIVVLYFWLGSRRKRNGAEDSWLWFGMTGAASISLLVLVVEIGAIIFLLIRGH